MNVFFDLDGVILDTEKPTFKLWKKLLGDKAGYLWWECLGLSTEDEFKCFKDILRWKRTVYDEFKLATLVAPTIKPESIKVLTALKQKNHTLTLVTSSSKNSTYEKLNCFNLAPFFTYIVTADDVTNCKPNAEPYELAKSLNNSSGDDVIVVEDSTAGMFSAYRAGLKNLIFFDDTVRCPYLVVKAVITDLNQLLDLI